MNPHTMRIAAAARAATAALCVLAVLDTAHAADPRPCDLLSASHIASVPGVAPKPAQASGPDTHRQGTGTSWTCVWPAGKVILVLDVHRFRSTAEAARALSEVKSLSRELPDDMSFSPVSGVGDQALWGTSDDTAVWFARKGPSVVAVVAGGEVKSPQALRDPLRGLITAALDKLP